jgi:hypothetical protein
LFSSAVQPLALTEPCARDPEGNEASGDPDR